MTRLQPPADKREAALKQPYQHVQKDVPYRLCTRRWSVDCLDTGGGRVVGQDHARGHESRLEYELAREDPRFECHCRQRRIRHCAAAVDGGVVLCGGRRLTRVLMMLVPGRRLCGLSGMMVLRIALVAADDLAHHTVVVAQHERRGGKCHHLAGQPDRRDQPDVRADTHHLDSLHAGQFKVQSAKVDTSLTSTRLPE